MSAIDKDREIAAKATHDGEWRPWHETAPNAPHGGVNLTVTDDEDRHIVRLHNRQPLYDALVDAVRAVIAMEGHGYLLPIGHPDAEIRSMLAQSVVRKVLGDALAALDREES